MASESKLTLLSIPAEIREKIYEFAMIEDKVIKINVNNLASPALLRVCRTIHREAVDLLGAYYAYNNFWLEVVDFNIAPLTIWYAKRADSIQRYKYTKRYDPWELGHLRILVSGRLNADNHFDWCARLWQGLIESHPVDLAPGSNKVMADCVQEMQSMITRHHAESTDILGELLKVYDVHFYGVFPF